MLSSETTFMLSTPISRTIYTIQAFAPSGSPEHLNASEGLLHEGEAGEEVELLAGLGLGQEAVLGVSWPGGHLLLAEHRRLPPGHPRHLRGEEEAAGGTEVHPTIGAGDPFGRRVRPGC